MPMLPNINLDVKIDNSAMGRDTEVTAAPAIPAISAAPVPTVSAGGAGGAASSGGGGTSSGAGGGGTSSGGAGGTSSGGGGATSSGAASGGVTSLGTSPASQSPATANIAKEPSTSSAAPDNLNAMGKPLEKCSVGSMYLCHKGASPFGRNANAALCKFDNITSIPPNTSFISCSTATPVDDDGAPLPEAFEQATPLVSDTATCESWLKEKATWPHGTKINTGRADSIWVALYHGINTEGFVNAEKHCTGVQYKEDYQNMVDARADAKPTLTSGNKGSVESCKTDLLNIYGKPDNGGKMPIEADIGYDLKHVWLNTAVTEFDRVAFVDDNCKVPYDPSFDVIPCAKQIQEFIRVKSNMGWATFDYPLKDEWENNIKNNAMPKCAGQAHNTEFQNIFEDAYKSYYQLNATDTLDGHIKACSNAAMTYVQAGFDEVTYAKFATLSDTRNTLSPNNVEDDGDLDTVRASCRHIFHKLPYSEIDTFYRNQCSNVPSKPAFCVNLGVNATQLSLGDRVVAILKAKMATTDYIKDAASTLPGNIKNVISILDETTKSELVKTGKDINLVLFKLEITGHVFSKGHAKANTLDVMIGFAELYRTQLLKYLENDLKLIKLETPTGQESIKGVFVIPFWELNPLSIQKATPLNTAQLYAKIGDDTATYAKIREFINLNKTLDELRGDTRSFFNKGARQDSDVYTKIYTATRPKTNDIPWTNVDEYRTLYTGVYDNTLTEDPTTLVVHKNHIVIAVRKTESPKVSQCPFVRVFACLKNDGAKAEDHEVHHLDANKGNNAWTGDFGTHGDPHQAFDNEIKNMIVLPIPDITTTSAPNFRDHSAKHKLSSSNIANATLDATALAVDVSTSDKEWDFIQHATMLGRNLCRTSC